MDTWVTYIQYTWTLDILITFRNTHSLVISSFFISCLAISSLVCVCVYLWEREREREKEREGEREREPWRKGGADLFVFLLLSSTLARSWVRQHTHKSDYNVWLHGVCVYWNKYNFSVLPYPLSFICRCTCTRRSSSTWTWGSLNAFWSTKSSSVNKYTSQSIKSGRTWLVTRRSSLGKDPDKKFKFSADYESFVKSSQDLDEVWSSKHSVIFPLRRFPLRVRTYYRFKYKKNSLSIWIPCWDRYSYIYFANLPTDISAYFVKTTELSHWSVTRFYLARLHLSFEQWSTRWSYSAYSLLPLITLTHSLLSICYRCRIANEPSTSWIYTCALHL